MKQYFGNFLLALISTVTVGLTSAYAGQVEIGPVTVIRVDAIGVTWSGQTAGNIEVELPAGFLPAGLTCSGGQFLTTKASDMTSNEYSLLLLARENGTPVYLWISDDAAHTAFGTRCSIYAVNF